MRIFGLIFCLMVSCFAFGQTPEEIQMEHLRKKNIAIAAQKEDKNSNLIDKIPSGYVGTVSVEINAPGAYPETAAGIETVHGWMVKPKIFLGAGVGYIHSVRYNEGVIPIFAESKFYFASEYMRRIYPHLGLRLGGQIATEGGAGIYSQAAIGFRIPLTEKLALNLEVGPQYVTQYTRGGRHDSTVTYKEPWASNGYTFGFFGRLGIEF